MATKEEAIKEMHVNLEFYKAAYEEILAVPVCPGIKT